TCALPIGEEHDVAGFGLDEDLLGVGRVVALAPDRAHVPSVALVPDAPAVAARDEPEAAVLGRHLGERDPELEMLVPEPVVGVVLVPVEDAGVRALRHRLIPAHPEIGPDDGRLELDERRLGDEWRDDRVRVAGIAVEAHRPRYEP